MTPVDVPQLLVSQVTLMVPFMLYPSKPIETIQRMNRMMLRTMESTGLRRLLQCKMPVRMRLRRVRKQVTSSC
jgi:hypothetical protein